MKVVFFLFFLFQCTILFKLQAQPHKIDSLKSLLINSVSDTNKVNILNELASQYRSWGSQLEESKRNAVQALAIAEELNFNYGTGQANTNLGNYHYLLNHNDMAFSYYEKALDYFQKSSRKRGLSVGYGNLGMVYEDTGNYIKALEYYLKSLKISEEIKDNSLIANNLGNIAIFLQDQKKYDEALKYNFRAIEFYKKTKDQPGLAFALNSIGNIYRELENYDEATSYLQQALTIFNTYNIDKGQIGCYNNLGLISFTKNDFDKALEYFEKALQKSEPGGYTSSTVIALNGIGNIYLKRGTNTNATNYYNRAFQLANQHHLVQDKLVALEGLGNSYAQAGNFKEAFIIQKQATVLKDSIFNQQNSSEIARLQSGYEVEKKQAEIELLKKDREQEALVRKFLIAVFFSFLIIAVLIVYTQRVKIRKNRLLLQKSKELAEKNTELKEQAELLEQQAEELELQTERLKELDKVKNNFFANISHEFRTPLTIIISGLGQKLDDFNRSFLKESLPIVKSEVAMMYRNAKRLLQLINQLLDLSKLESGQMRLFLKKGDFIKFAKVVLASFSSLAESKNIRLQYSLPSHSIICYFDSDKVETILYNLLSNAIKFTPEGGLVTFEITFEETSNTIRMSVTDNGPGIPEVELERIFNRFYQVDSSTQREFEGSGIGLSLTRELIELMEGNIEVKSKVGMGTDFTITLPIIEKTESSNELEEIEESYYELLPSLADVTGDEINNHTSLRNESLSNTILLVEDNDDLRAYINSILEKEYKVIQAINGFEALEVANENIPDLILSDMMMPKMDGFTLCEEIRKNELTCHIPFVLLTARSAIESRLKGLELGADEYLTKPFNLKELKIRIKNLLEQRRNLRERFGKELKIKPGDVTVTSTDEKFIRKAMKLVENNISNSGFSVEIFSEEMGMSRKNLHRKLTALINQGPNEFIRSFRLNRAKQLIEQDGGNIGEIAYATGFNNLSYFAKCFKDQFGISPTEIRSAKEV